MKAVSLFSGCGGSDAGLIQLGVSIQMANDIYSYAKETYLANHPETDYVLGDITNISKFPAADLLVGCYPCQGFSQGGKRKADTSINYLYRQFNRALLEIRPKAFVVENVSGMLRKNNLKLFNNQIVRFRLAGYKVQSCRLNARDFGLAQNRNRIFIVGIRSDQEFNYSFPTPTFGLSEGMRKFKTIRDSIGGMNPWPKGEFYDYDFHWYYLSRNRYRNWDDQSTTIVSNERHVGLHPSSPKLIKIGPDKWEFENDSPSRRFSYREAAVLQGFEKNFIFPDSGNRTHRYKVVGNAVPPPLFREVCRPIVNALE